MQGMLWLGSVSQAQNEQGEKLQGITNFDTITSDGPDPDVSICTGKHPVRNQILRPLSSLLTSEIDDCFKCKHMRNLQTRSLLVTTY